MDEQETCGFFIQTSVHALSKGRMFLTFFYPLLCTEWLACGFRECPKSSAISSQPGRRSLLPGGKDGFAQVTGASSETQRTPSALASSNTAWAGNSAAKALTMGRSRAASLFGNPATLVIDFRPMALRPYLSIGLPLSERHSESNKMVKQDKLATYPAEISSQAPLDHFAQNRSPVRFGALSKDPRFRSKWASGQGIGW